jgi:hypothetical protein
MAESGIQLRDNNGQMRSTTDILNDYADVVQNAESQQERLRLAFQAFDSEGAALVSVLQNGSAGMREMIADARELSAVVSQRSLIAINRLTNRLKVFAIQGVGWAAEKLGKFVTMIETVATAWGAMSTGASLDEVRAIVHAQMDTQSALNDIAAAQQAITQEVARQTKLEEKKVNLIQAQRKAVEALATARGDRSRSKLEEIAGADINKQIREHAALNRQRFRSMQLLRERATLERRRGNGGRAGQLEAQATGLNRLIQAGSGINQNFLRNEQKRARTVLALEAEGERMKRLGFFQASQRLFGRAGSIRENMASLNTAEQNPMANLEQAAAQSTEELQKVNRELADLRAQIAAALR